ncbi:MAG: winged helix-turn-helix transcriptional regulator [Flavobacteriaceae bacterium]
MEISQKRPPILISEKRSSCPISTSLEIIGDHWSLVILRDFFLKRNTFTDFKNSPEKIATNILTDRINKLTKYNLISYIRHPKNRKIKQYYLTESGIQLYPVLYDLSMWSKDHLDMEFHPLSKEWYQNNKNKKREEVINNAISEYKSFKEKLLSS